MPPFVSCGGFKTSWKNCQNVHSDTDALLMLSLVALCASKETSSTDLESCRAEAQRQLERNIGYIACVADVLHRRGLPHPRHSKSMIMNMQVESADAFLNALLRPGVERYLEWGSGGSTELVAWLAVSRQLPHNFHAYSLETSQIWMKRMREKQGSVIQSALHQGQLSYELTDIGPTGHLGFPTTFNPGNRTFRKGVEQNLVSLSRFNMRYDVVFIDGRFRVACAIEALRWIHNNSTVMLHDSAPPMFEQRYRWYRKGVAPFYDIVGFNGSLMTAVPRASALAMAKQDSKALQQVIWDALAHAE